MSPLQSDSNYDPNFWRQWNSAVANSGAGQTSTLGEAWNLDTPDFGQFENQYNQAQFAASLPTKERLTYQQNQIENQLNSQREQRLIGSERFDRGIALQRLQMDMEAARAKQMGDPNESVWKELQNLERGFGHNPLEILNLADATPDWEKTGMVKLPPRYQIDPITGREMSVPGKDVRITPEYVAHLRRLRSQVLPSMPRQTNPFEGSPDAEGFMSGDEFAGDQMARMRYEELLAKGAPVAQPPMSRAAAAAAMRR